MIVFLYPFCSCLEWACSIFGESVFNVCEVGFDSPNEVGVWWPSVYGGPSPKALHFQPWVGLGL